MTKTSVNRNDVCSCGSGLLAKVCCYPIKPPINMPVPRYVTVDNVPITTRVDGFVDDSIRIQIESQLTQLFNLTVKIGNESGPGFLPRVQANEQIAFVLGYGLNEYHLDKQRNEHALIGPLHSVKYHQQQCMYRLYVLQQKSKKLKRNSRPQQSNHINIVRTFQFEDLPLRAEFEAFISRISSSLDALAQYACKCLGKDPKDYSSHFKLTNHLKKNANDGVEWLNSLRDKYLAYEDWSRIINRELRDYVIHEGTLWSLEAGKDMSVEVPFVPPSWQGKDLETLCVEHWKTLIEFVGAVRQTLVFYRFTT